MKNGTDCIGVAEGAMILENILMQNMYISVRHTE